jgi:hypothetical protein
MKNPKSKKSNTKEITKTTDFSNIKNKYNEFNKTAPDGMVYSEVLYDPAHINIKKKS